MEAWRAVEFTASEAHKERVRARANIITLAAMILYIYLGVAPDAAHVQDTFYLLGTFKRNFCFYNTFLPVYLGCLLLEQLVASTACACVELLPVGLAMWIGCWIIALMNVPPPDIIDAWFNERRRRFHRHNLTKRLKTSRMMSALRYLRRRIDIGWLMWNNMQDRPRQVLRA